MQPAFFFLFVTVLPVLEFRFHLRQVATEVWSVLAQGGDPLLRPHRGDTGERADDGQLHPPPAAGQAPEAKEEEMGLQRAERGPVPLYRLARPR